MFLVQASAYYDDMFDMKCFSRRFYFETTVPKTFSGKIKIVRYRFKKEKVSAIVGLKMSENFEILSGKSQGNIREFLSVLSLGAGPRSAVSRAPDS